MQKWEYKILKDPSEYHLNALGMEGWELVAVTAAATGYDSDVVFVFAYLKRLRFGVSG